MRLSARGKLGPYEILTAIGKGRMGEVWKARDSRLDRTVAMVSLRSLASAKGGPGGTAFRCGKLSDNAE
jgi:hypothetical protein